ncbi:hypothetical protein F4780DRAFT_470525 [Xylariomycetidae sp. FL0641]|nr:hypothetical protein F4780DRAFT_470525 [Xylariomycetidae sp. FL0641]
MADQVGPEEAIEQDGVVIEDEDEDEDEDDPLDHGDNMHFMMRILIHRDEEVYDPIPQDWHPNAWTLDYKPPVFPFNLSPTWLCVSLIALVIAVHLEIDTGWLLKGGYLHWAVRVLFRTSMTLIIAVFSTLCFEVLGGWMDMQRDNMLERFQRMVEEYIVRHWRWGELDPDDGEPARNADGEIEWIHDDYWLREPVRNAVVGLLGLLYNFTVLNALQGIYTGLLAILDWVIVPVLGLFSTGLANFVIRIPFIFTLPTPGQFGLDSPTDLLHEYGAPIAIQIWLAVFFWLLTFLYAAKSNGSTQRGFSYDDPAYQIIFSLCRATAMHIIAYTSYQLTCMLLVGLHYTRLGGAKYEPLVDPQIIGHYPSPGSAALLLLCTWFVNHACVLGVRLLSGFWTHYIVWLSYFTWEGADPQWQLFIPYMRQDMNLWDPDKRVLPRAVMTALFGLQSSWPARLRLSNNRGVDETVLRV